MSERRSYPWYFAGLLILGFLPFIAILSAGVAPAVATEGWASALGWALAGIGVIGSIAYGLWTQTQWSRILG